MFEINFKDETRDVQISPKKRSDLPQIISRKEKINHNVAII